MTVDTSPVRTISAEDLPVIVAGNQMLSSAMGSASLDGINMWAEELLRRSGPIPLIALDDLPDDALCTAVGAIGGYAAMVELPPSGGEPEVLARVIQGRLGRKLDAVVSMNAAGVNAILPIAMAAALGIPLVDCDGMGRVFPLITQTTFAVAGLPISPIAAVGMAGDSVAINTSLLRADVLLRAAMHAAGGWMLCALYPNTPRELRKGAIEGSMSRVVHMGRLLTTARDRNTLLSGLARTVGARVLGSGRVVELGHASQSDGARHYPAMPTSIVVAEYTRAGRMIRLEAQNELLLAVIDGAVAAAVPDLLCLLDRQELRVVGLESVTVGDHVDVLVVPADPMWHSPQGLALAGPRAFGFPVRHPSEEGHR